ncbi:YkvI family membrane protein [Oceanivirga salmonicida]|uniref:YkvI family membrane protein n=1 Tax=Oceanivirga salmonicida TaxID=1769291 RepID=UPI000836CFDC|nr:hypothetical protein [Oceanivirga salmonicida]
MGDNKNLINWKRVIILAGAVIAFTIGSGFATGQEIIQYYTAYGMKNFLVIAVFMITFLYYNFSFAKAGSEQKFAKANDIYRYYCGDYIGGFYDYYSTSFCYMSFWVMVGGAASTLNQEYGLPIWMGATILTVMTVITVVGGLNSLVDAIGIVGPIVVVLCITIGLITFVRDGSNISSGLEIIKNSAYEGAKAGESIKNAGANWLISGLSYAGFVLLWFASFTSALAIKNNKKDLQYGIIGGTLAICIAIALVSFAQIANINTSENGVYVWNAAIPNLILATKIWRPFSSIFAMVVFAGIYTTAVPLLYNPVSRFSDEGTSKFRLLTIALGLIGLIVGLYLPFRVLVNIIYVLNGYVGALLLFFMLWKDISIFRSKKNS